MKLSLFRHSLLALVVFSALTFTGCGDDDDSSTTPQFEDFNGGIKYNGTEAGTGTVTWTAGTEYYLDGFVFVNPGDTLTIEPGTVIRGIQNPTNGDNASALIVSAGATIIADGTPTNPIVFTSELDTDLNSETDIPAANARGLWGGVIILGNAQVNTSVAPQQIEGIPTDETRAGYGSTGAANNGESSGTFRYVSIRHGGSEIGAGNEINGLTLGGVGSGTQIDHVEVIYNLDDGVEFFGGTVNTKWMAVAFCGDDTYDYDQGFTGKGQFWFSLMPQGGGDRGGEHDGGTDPENGQPFANPTIYNATYIGGDDTSSTRGITFRDNAGGKYYNSIIASYGRGVDVEFRADRGGSSWDRYKAGELVFSNNLFYDMGQTGNNVYQVRRYEGKDANDDDILVSDTLRLDTLLNGTGGFNAWASLNTITTMAPFVDAASIRTFPLNPTATGPATSGAATPPADGFFDVTATFRGAFATSGTGATWLDGWSFLSTNGYIGN